MNPPLLLGQLQYVNACTHVRTLVNKPTNEWTNEPTECSDYRSAPFEHLIKGKKKNNTNMSLWPLAGPCTGYSAAPSSLSASAPAPASAESAGPPRSAPPASLCQSGTCTHTSSKPAQSGQKTTLPQGMSNIGDINIIIRILFSSIMIWYIYIWSMYIHCNHTYNT